MADLRQAVAATSTLRAILDIDWFNAVEKEIRSSDRPSTTDHSGFIYDFFHPLRGVPWFEDAQRLDQEGKVADVTEGGKFALWFTGRDPIKGPYLAPGYRPMAAPHHEGLWSWQFGLSLGWSAGSVSRDDLVGQ